ncbi:MAG: hypothetical protein V8S95_09470 [Odoribacter sp.]
MFFAGTDGVEAMDVPEVAGGGAGDCGVGVCAGRPSGAGEGAADEGGGGFSEAEGRGGAAVVPDKQMEDFRFLLDFSEEAVEMTNENIKAGDLVRVVKGSLRGMEGELIRHKGVTKVLVRIDMLGCAMVNIPASFVERVNK